MDYSLPGSSARGILQTQTLELVAIPLSRGSSWPGIEPSSLILQANSLLSEPPDSDHFFKWFIKKKKKEQSLKDGGGGGVCGLYTASLIWKAILKRWRMKTNEAEEWEPPEDRLTSWWACEQLRLSAAGAVGDALQNTGLKKGVIHPWLPSFICQELPRGWSAPCTSRCVTESEQLSRSLQLYHQEVAETDTYRVTKVRCSLFIPGHSWVPQYWLE